MASIVTKFRKFLTKHSDELSIVGQGLSMVLTALPVPRAEKEKILEAVDGLQENAKAIAASASKMTESLLQLTDADRESIARKVATQLSKDIPALVAKAVQDELAKVTAPKPSPQS